MSKVDRNDAKYFRRRPGGDKAGFWLRLVAGILKPMLVLVTKRSWSGMRHVPMTGGVILACNHISQADPLPVSHYVFNTGRNPQFLAKDGVFKVPVAGKLIRWTGQIPVYRGGADAVKSLHAAIATVNRGEPVVFYPEGTTSKQPEHWPMRGRTGIARLVKETGAPVIPMTVWGPQDIFDPLTKKFRFPWRVPVTVTAGEAVDLSPWDDAPADSETLHAMTDAIMLRIRDQLAELRGEAAPPLYDFKAAKAAGEDS
ncbi:MAG TPA: lysophospholipid acyltransferase family protein [Stackebrandtia sp.]|uniref:lysophospholipid acyltransferase family protein n=1 Tax=Stackebrandtia sp. TaxID=2023065 RepID=UPI002D63D486|nr:lysophospholipid acyltransferase family protein [Stackebrandtia sp.]HZE40198.1 lysophospholipid acyltransferase family protein [Stackebrandtia sp.]